MLKLMKMGWQLVKNLTVYSLLKLILLMQDMILYVLGSPKS